MSEYGPTSVTQSGRVTKKINIMKEIQNQAAEEFIKQGKPGAISMEAVKEVDVHGANISKEKIGHLVCLYSGRYFEKAGQDD